MIRRHRQRYVAALALLPCLLLGSHKSHVYRPDSAWYRQWIIQDTSVTGEGNRSFHICAGSSHEHDNSGVAALTACRLPFEMRWEGVSARVQGSGAIGDDCTITLEDNGSLISGSAIAIGDGESPTCDFENHDGDLDTDGEGCTRLISPPYVSSHGSKMFLQIDQGTNGCTNADSAQLANVVFSIWGTPLYQEDINP